MKNLPRICWFKTPLLPVLIFVAVCAAQCKTGEKTNVDATGNEAMNTPSTTTSMADTLRSSTLNTDKTMELRVKKVMGKGDPAAHLFYTIYKRGTDTIIKKGEYRGMDIIWNDASSIKLAPYVGMERKPESDNPLEASKTKSRNEPVIIRIKDSLH